MCDWCAYDDAVFHNVRTDSFPFSHHQLDDLSRDLLRLFVMDREYMVCREMVEVQARVIERSRLISFLEKGTYVFVIGPNTCVK